MILKNKDKVLFVGDSITDAGRGRPVGERLGLGSGFVRQIDNFLQVFYPENLYHIVNMGVDGDTSRDVLNRLQRDVIDLNPDVVVCCIGVNDVWRFFDSPEVTEFQVPVDEYENNLRKIISQLNGKIRQLIFLTPYYIESNKNDPLRQMMDKYREVVLKLCKEYNLLCVDMQKPFDDYLQYRYPAFIGWDRVHPLWIGSLIMARTFLKAIGFEKQFI